MKKLISIVLCVAMLCGTMATAIFSANAYELTIRDELDKVYYEYMSSFPDGQTVPPPPLLFYSPSSYQRLMGPLKDAEKVLDNMNATDEELQQAYDNIMAVEMYIDPKWAQESYGIALAEPFDSYWWTESLWTEFQAEIADLKTALDGGDEKTIDTAYKALNYTFNEACNSHKVYGDVNKDGRATIADATLIQKGLAGLEPYSGVQKFNSSIRYFDGYKESIYAVTHLQEELAGIIGDAYHWHIYSDDYNVRNYILAPDHSDV